MLNDEKIINFMTKAQVGDFETLFKAISEIKVKNINFESTNKKKCRKKPQNEDCFVCLQTDIRFSSRRSRNQSFCFKKLCCFCC